MPDGVRCGLGEDFQVTFEGMGVGLERLGTPRFVPGDLMCILEDTRDT